MLATPLALLVLVSQGPTGPTEDQKAIFELLDRFDSLDTSSRPFVKVTTGEQSVWEENQLRYGFLLTHGERRFKVRWLDGSTMTLEPEADHVRAGWENADLRQHARQVAERLAALRQDEDAWRHYTEPGSLFEPNAVGALMARACARREHFAEMHAIWKELGSLDELRRSLASGLWHRLSIDFADPQLSWADLVARHELWLATFGEHYCRDSVHDRLEQLKAIVASERSRGSASARGDPPPEAAMQELVRLLRNEFHHVSRPGYFGGWPLPTAAKEDESCPVVRLRQAGLSAVPVLIAALADETPTRTVFHSSRYGGGFFVQPVSTLALGLLQEISGLPLYERDAWEKWRKAVAENGERATLTSWIADEQAGPAAAERLLARWPDSLDDVLRIASQTEGESQRAQLVELVAKSPASRVTEFLVAELASRHPSAQLAAAKALLARGRRDGIAAMRDRWAAAARQEPADQPVFASLDPHEELARFLLRSGDPEAVRMVTEDAMTRRGPARTAMIETFSRSLGHLLEHASEPDKPAVCSAVERAFVALLEDRARQAGVSTTFGWRDRYVSWSDPRPCDYAACALVALWPDRYAFDPDATTGGRDRAILTMQNGWRQREGLPLLPVPAPLPRLAGANTVRLCEVRSELGTPPPQALLDRAKEIEGKPLEATAVIEFLFAATKHLKEGCGDVTLVAERPGDATGVTLRWTLSKPTEHDSCGMSFVVTAAGRSLANSSGAGVSERYDDATDFASQQRSIDKALATEAAKGFEIRLTLRRR